MLKIERKHSGDVNDFYTTHASTAIWRFYELMYLSYPPGDILKSLEHAWSTEDDEPDERKEYERYRWAVYEWCLRNWKRLEANTAIEIFIDQAKKEIKHNTPLIQPILEGCSQHFQAPQVIQFVAECIDMLAEFEFQRVASDRGADLSRIESTIDIYTALAIFWLNIPANKWGSICFKKSPKDEKVLLIDHLDKSAIALDSRGHSFLRNLYRQLKRPQKYIDPKWALDTIAESLFRGRDPLIYKHGRHHLLPRLISNILIGGIGGADDEERSLLHGSLTLFIAALDDILHFDYQLSIDIPEIKELSFKVLKGLKYPSESKEGRKTLEALQELSDALSLDGQLCEEFNKTFHEEVESLRKYLEDRAKQLGKDRLDFSYEPLADTKHSHVLIHGQRLRIHLANLAIDRMGKVKTKHKSRIEVSRKQDEKGKDSIVFRILTNFAPLEETIQLTTHGQSIKTDQFRLEPFGAKFDEKWRKPSNREQELGFTAAYEFSVPSGFVTRRK